MVVVEIGLLWLCGIVSTLFPDSDGHDQRSGRY